MLDEAKVKELLAGDAEARAKLKALRAQLDAEVPRRTLSAFRAKRYGGIFKIESEIRTGRPAEAPVLRGEGGRRPAARGDGSSSSGHPPKLAVLASEGGRYEFMPCQVHVDYGAGEPDDPIREEEIHLVASVLATRAEEEQA